MSAIIRPIRSEDIAEWQRLRIALWSDVSSEELASEMNDWLAGQQCAVIVAERPAGGLCGFLEVALRPCNVSGEVGQFGHIEGWFVDPDVRLQGIGESLVRAAETWVKAQGCKEIHSDARIENQVSQSAHAAIGYIEVERLVHFRKRLE